jgi:hypothetical protein
MTCKAPVPGTDSTLATIEVMRRQEETTYKSYDYLHQQAPQFPAANGPLSSTPGPATAPVDGDCRFRMSEWCYQIVDFCKFKRETVAISMSCLDRFLCSPGGREAFVDRSTFQLAAMTTLYTAIKVHEPEAMEPSLVASLSRGAFCKEQVEAMEITVLKAIQWSVNPPTAMSFILGFLDLIPEHLISEEAREAVLDLAKFQAELAVSDCDFIAVNASSIALASLINAFESMNMDLGLQLHIQNILSEAAKIEIQSSVFRDIRIRLYEAICGQSESHLCSNLSPETTCSGECSKGTSSVLESPRSVLQPAE